MVLAAAVNPSFHYVLLSRKQQLPILRRNSMSWKIDPIQHGIVLDLKVSSKK